MSGYPAGPGGPAGPEGLPLSTGAVNGPVANGASNGPSRAPPSPSAAGTFGAPQNGPAQNGTTKLEDVKPEMKKGGDGGDETKAPTPTGEEVDFKKIPIAEALRVLKATEQGLTSAEHKKRLEEYGPNKLPESSRNPILVYLGYMWNPLSWAMEVALIVSICLLDYADFCLIIALLLCNATISYVEESNADKAIKALTAALAPKAKCLRDGTVSTIDAQELVPGDIIVVRLGEIVPADIKLLGETGEDDHPMQVDQAALTGESLPVKKFSGDVCFSGSSIKQGEKHAVVYATGSNTFFGRAAALIGATNNVANIQKIMTKIGGVCLVTIGIWVIIELAVQFGHYGHSCKSGAGNCPTLTNMLVIIVGGIPIAMPTVLSVTLALGAYKLAKEGAIVARMSAVEEMAGMDILCSDKTGTLTLNKLSVDANIVFPMGGHQPQDVLKYAALSAQKNSEEAIDRVLAESYPGYEQLWNQYEISKFIPFNPVDKYTIAYVTDKQSGETYRLMKGAPQIVLKHAYNYQEVATVGNQKITEFANRGFRALGVARGPAQGAIKDAKWEMVGLLPLFDPPRHDTKETIERCLEKGLLVKMITGDQALIGKETAKQLGMGHNIFNTEVLLRAKEGKGFPEGFSSLKELVEKADGFAEVFPEHKFLIVELLKKERHIVGMTGDGVNDAPALKKADVGIAVDGATDAARGAADIVLTKPGLATIVTAIIGSRKIFQRMTTYSKYTVAMTFRICFTFGLLTVLYNWYFPTILIVLLAVFNDGAMIALSKDRVTASTLPNSWDLKNIFISGIVYGLYLTLSSWVYFFVITHTDFPRDNLKMFTLNLRQRELARYCNQYIPTLGLDPTASVCTVPQYQGQGPACIPPTGGVEAEGITVFDQCMAEQYYIRASIARTAIYSHVSISGQALVFVVRCKGWSLLARAGVWTYLAFMIAQIMATIISAIGFGGYEYPNDGFGNCQFCRLVYGSDLRTGGRPPFMHAYNVPRAFSEDVHQSSVVACTYYVVFSWIWAIIWYLGLDPIKWVLAYILDEDGARTGKHLPAGSEAGPKASEPETHGIMSGQVSRHNPLGRVSVSRPSPAQLERASIARVGPMPPPPPRTSLGRLSMGRQSLGRTSKDQAKSVV